MRQGDAGVGSLTGLLSGPSWYEILGVKPDTTSADIRRAHRELVAELEADDSPEAEDRLGEAKVAFAVLRDPARRKEHDQLLAGKLAFLGTPPLPQDGDEDTCRLCGSEPAAAAPLHRVTGAGILWVQTRTTGPFCRPCGIAVFRAFQDHSLTAGWWGVAAIFFNAWAVVRNVLSRRAFAGLDSPEEHDAVAANAPRPLDPAPSLFRRSGIWIVVGLAIVVVVGLAAFVLRPGGGFSRSAADYIPASVDGKPVDPTSAFAKSVTQALDDPAVEDVRSGTVGGGGAGAEALPELILAAAETRDPDATKERLKTDLTNLENKVDTRQVEGVDVQVFNVSSDEGGTGISFAFASPDGAIVLWSIAFQGDSDNALAGMKAMLEAGEK